MKTTNFMRTDKNINDLYIQTNTEYCKYKKHIPTFSQVSNFYLKNKSGYSINNKSTTTNETSMMINKSVNNHLKTFNSTEKTKFTLSTKNTTRYPYIRATNIRNQDKSNISIKVEPIKQLNLMSFENNENSKEKTFKEADKILKNRENKFSPGAYSLTRNKIISDLKQISKKNYLIRTLKEKTKEYKIKMDYIDSASDYFRNGLYQDKKKFVEFVAMEKEEKKREEERLIEAKKIKTITDDKYNMKFAESKKLEEAREIILKVLWRQKDYANFVSKIFGYNFIYGNMPQHESIKDYEKISKEFIKLAEQNNIDNPDFLNILENYEIFIQRYNQFQEKVAKALYTKESLLEEINNLKNIEEKELERLKTNKTELENEYQSLLNEKAKTISFLKNYKVEELSEKEQCIKYIEQLTNLLELNEDNRLFLDSLEKKREKEEEKGFKFYHNKIIYLLNLRESKICNYINYIENILEGNKNDQELLLGIIHERKKVNKKEKQLEFKLKVEKLNEDKTKKNLERANRIVIIGRNVPKEFPIIKKKIKKKVMNKKDKNNKYSILEYSSSEEEY